MANAVETRVRLRRSAPELLIVLSMWLLILWGVGAQWWTGMNAPDSQFSASLAIFGNEVNERALDSSYYWTRLGYLGPVHWLIENFGIWSGFAIWRALIVLIVVGAVYWIARQFAGRALAITLTLFVALNTMVLAYLGNPYATGTAMAASFLLFALGIWHFNRHPRTIERWLAAGLAGGVLAWLLMLNPYNALLAGLTWLGIRTIGIWITRPRVQLLLTELLAMIIGFAVIFLGFLLWAWVLFPDLNWFQTYRSWNARLDYSSFISDPNIWTRDLAALVVLLAFLISLVAIVFARNRWSTTAVVISSITITFTLLYMQVIPGPWIEAPHYAAMCWPASLLALVLAIGAISHERESPALMWLAVPLVIVTMVWAGHSSALLSMAQGLMIVLACVLTMLLTILLLKFGSQVLTWTLVTFTVIAIGVSAQLLQNGRGNLGIYSQYPMNSAFVDYQAEALMRSNVQAQEFLLAHTSDDDRVAIWTDPSRLTATVAAMQFWGAYNNAPGEAWMTLADHRALRDLNPTVIAMYAPTRAEIDQYFSSIPAWFSPSPLECTSVPYLGIGSPDAHMCLTHITVQ